MMNKERKWNLPEERSRPQPPPTPRLPWIWLIFPALLVASLFWSGQMGEFVPYNEFLKAVQDNRVDEVALHEDRIQASLKTAEGEEEKSIFTYRVEDEELVPLLKAKGIEFRALPSSDFWSTLLIWGFPLLILYFIFRGSAGMRGGNLLSFGKSKAKIYLEKDISTRFSDVAGVDEAKDELLEVVNFLKNPQLYSRLGGRAPKGVLLVGPPGTGKTLMARAVAGEAGVPFFLINGSEFVELFVGMGAARVRDLFEQARRQAPCIIFIDELDALGKSRTFGQFQGGSHDEKEQTLNQLLAELDGFESGSGVVILAATNRPEVLDPALLRAGRFDRQVLLDNPDQNGRRQILQIHVKKIVLAADVDLKAVASMTPGFSGADLENLVNEAALTATREGAKAVELPHFTKAIERLVAGLERRQRIIHPEEKRRVAFHEMGHTTVALTLQTYERVQKVSVIPRGVGALGYTLQRPLEDRYLMTKNELLNKVMVLLGGRVAESVFFGDISTGASDDLVKASNIVRSMITQYGMSETIGLMAEDQVSRGFLKNQNPLIPASGWSEKTGEKVDEEVGAWLADCQERTRQVIAGNRGFIERAVRELLEKETLEAEEIQDLWRELGHPNAGEAKARNVAGL